jgi:CO dehydrogenase/acetyl-CoA synthase gamma subunit (corrinoid Fe-S protein)
MDEQKKAKTQARGPALQTLPVWQQIKNNVTPEELIKYTVREGDGLSVEEVGIFLKIDSDGLVVRLQGGDEQKFTAAVKLVSYSKIGFNSKVV